jgi:probable rRNA maturation factor
MRSRPDERVIDPTRPRLPGRPKVGGEGEPEVFCADEQQDVPLDLDRWQSLALAVLGAQGVRGAAELSVLFVGETQMGELNEGYMGKPGPTDVLAFPIDVTELPPPAQGEAASRGPDRAPLDPSDVPLMLGDVVICPAVAARQAPEHAGTVDDELALLLVHGILHVLGFDHAEVADRDRMRARELELLQMHHWRGNAPTTFRQGHDEQDETT